MSKKNVELRSYYIGLLGVSLVIIGSLFVNNVAGDVLRIFLCVIGVGLLSYILTKSAALVKKIGLILVVILFLYLGIIAALRIVWGGAGFMG